MDGWRDSFTFLAFSDLNGSVIVKNDELKIRTIYGLVSAEAKDRPFLTYAVLILMTQTRYETFLISGPHF